jgi:hypothetical protein
VLQVLLLRKSTTFNMSSVSNILAHVPIRLNPLAVEFVPAVPVLVAEAAEAAEVEEEAEVAEEVIGWVNTAVSAYIASLSQPECLLCGMKGIVVVSSAGVCGDCVGNCND